jgi:hypothetical protein
MDYRHDANVPSYEFVEHLHNLLHVGRFDRFLGRGEDAEGGRRRSIFNEATTRSEKTANEEKFEELLRIPDPLFTLGGRRRIKKNSLTF